MADQVRPLSPERRQDVLLRLRRIEGQVRGIQRMVEDDRDCREIVTQVAAVKSALASVSSQVLRCYAHNCLDNEEESREKTIADLIHLFEGK
ncbi:metal-sensitive transcriptional regulator [Candidatus Oscillochloris fontis]|uniref:metal-sensitive transcriptional regulator n=1 Tax=Candidatus Oscillochloris fontis TaxID=2496868 RepID=UPI00101CB896|nr:metal-sensitive transcriptional regulator [Candidatus Oscillochloris fontis]